MPTNPSKTSSVVIVGATSAIATATARAYAAEGSRLHLFARNLQKLETLAQDLRVRGAQEVFCTELDVLNYKDHNPMLQEAWDSLGQVDVFLVAHGTLPDQEACQKDAATALEALNVNALATISLLTHGANAMEKAGSGTIAVITSVAGDRGRQSNYVYGAAKGMVSIFLQGLRNRLHPSGVHVLDIRPGFVDTPMTAHLAKGGPLWAQPSAVAKGIQASIQKSRAVAYLPRFWQLIMLVVRNVPEAIFCRMKL